jgi:choline dehydrogenase-like flavoprotein
MIAFDALVIGGGVAGCAAALELLSDGWRIGILHRRDDVTGIESLAPSAVHDMSRHSIQVGHVLPEIVAWWGSDRETRAAQSGARIVQRTLLANALRGRALERGAIIMDTARLLSIERSRKRWVLRVAARSASHLEITARYLVDGTGRASSIARRLGARRMIIDELFCTSVSLHEPDLVGAWTESVSDGWWNLCCTREEGTLSFYSAARIIREAKRDFAACFCGTRHLRCLLPSLRLGTNRTRTCGSSRLVPCAGPSWVAFGFRRSIEGLSGCSNGPKRVGAPTGAVQSVPVRPVPRVSPTIEPTLFA